MSQAIPTAVLEGEPAWEVARLFPNQGGWSDYDYLLLPTNNLVELSDGVLEVLPMPTTEHQRIVAFLYQLLNDFLKAGNLGTVLFAPLRVRLWEGKFREPDLLAMLAGNLHRIHSNYWDGADLVMEVVSDDDPGRDLDTKRREYARAEISEYWIVDPRTRVVTVLALDAASGEYRVEGEYRQGELAQSALFPGFTVDVADVFSQSEHLIAAAPRR